MLGTATKEQTKAKATPGWLKTLTAQARQQMDVKAAVRLRVDEPVKKAAAVTAKALDAYKAAVREEDRQKQIRLRELAAIDSKLQPLLHQLALATAPTIGEVRVRIESRFQRMRQLHGQPGGLRSYEQAFSPERYGADGRPAYQVFSNRKHVETIVSQINDARDRLAALRDNPPEDYEAELAKIEASIRWELLERLDPL